MHPAGIDHQTPPVSPERILKISWGYAPPILVASAIENGLFDALDRESLNARDLAAAIGSSPRGVSSVADALAGIELLVKSPDGLYSLAPDASTFLVKGKPGYRGGMFAHMLHHLMPHWMQLPNAMRTGLPVTGVNQADAGSKFFEGFVEALYPMNYPGARALAEALGVHAESGSVSVLDLAAGSGVWGIALAQASPRVQVTAVDWPDVLKTTRRVSERFGVSDQLRYVPGDILEADLGSGFDVATLGHILHSE